MDEMGEEITYPELLNQAIVNFLLEHQECFKKSID